MKTSEFDPIPATTMVIIGITGDLARRKLLPAIAAMAEAGVLPEKLRLIGVSRRPLTIEDVLNDSPSLNARGHSFLREHLEMYQMDLDQPSDYRALEKYLQEIASYNRAPTQQLFYLSIPPQFAQPVVAHMGQAGLANMPHTKLLLEKPFGTDLESAQDLIDQTKTFFQEEQLYRIDHYLAKEMAQAILAFRQYNPLFAHTWNNQFIDKIEIIASEQIGIEERGTFYEQTGALRDIVQSHLLQLAALTLMDIPNKRSDWQSARLAALQALIPPSELDLPMLVKRGQYQGYAQEASNPGSTVETFAALTLFSEDKRWQNVPIQLITGKALAEKTTEIRIHYKPLADHNSNQAANLITLRVQPEEGIEIQIWVKKPGHNNEVISVPLAFKYGNHYSETLPDAYEHVLFEALSSDRGLFVSTPEVLACWRLLEPIQRYWQKDTTDLTIYQQGKAYQEVLEQRH